MYKQVEKVLLDSGIAEQFPEPVWMDKNGTIVKDEFEGFQYKVTIDVNWPYLGIVLDKCGCNISQEGDGNVGGELFLAGVKDKALKSTPTKHYHFTVIGITQLDGNPFMCMVIVSEKKSW